MDVVYREGQATAIEVLSSIPDPPSYSAVRAMLRVLETKGHLRHVVAGPRYVYLPTVPRDRARRSALANMLQTFFEGSAAKAVVTLLDISRPELSAEDLDRLSRWIDRAREEGR